VRIAQQPTALDEIRDPRLDELQRALESRGFAVQRVRDMSGWLAYHAVFVASISAALYHCQTDPQRLASDREELRLMCRAIAQGFQALRTQGVVGLPRNLGCCTRARCSLWPFAIGRAACAHRWASSRLRLTAATPSPRCARWPATSLPAFLATTDKTHFVSCSHHPVEIVTKEMV
jgi:hypothetical protein